MVSEAKDIHRSLFYISHKKRPDVHSCPAGLLLLRTLRWVRDSSVYRRWNGWGCNAFTWGQEVKKTLCQLCQHELEIKWLHLSYSVKKYIFFSKHSECIYSFSMYCLVGIVDKLGVVCWTLRCKGCSVYREVQKLIIYLVLFSLDSQRDLWGIEF